MPRLNVFLENNCPSWSSLSGQQPIFHFLEGSNWNPPVYHGLQFFMEVRFKLNTWLAHWIDLVELGEAWFSPSSVWPNCWQWTGLEGEADENKAQFLVQLVEGTSLVLWTFRELVYPVVSLESSFKLTSLNIMPEILYTGDQWIFSHFVGFLWNCFGTHFSFLINIKIVPSCLLCC